MSKQQQTYWQKLRDPRWQKKRLEIMQRDDFMCQNCFDSGSTLNVHHKTYTKGAEPWEYDEENFVTLCESCHKSNHELIETIKHRVFAPFMHEILYELMNNEYFDEFCASSLMFAQQYYKSETRERNSSRMRQCMEYYIEHIQKQRGEESDE